MGILQHGRAIFLSTDQGELVVDDSESAKDIIAELSSLPPGTLITEAGLARIWGKCRDSIRSAVERGELPPSVRIMGKPTWTSGSIIRHIEGLLEAEARKFRKHSA